MRVWAVLGLLAGALLVVAMPAARALAASLVLNPSSGNPPSVTGSLSGGGWTCSGGAVPSGSATVSGTGVGGSATINRDGTVSGTFNVRGSAGQSIVVTVQANTACPGIVPVFLQASATFTFNAPTPTPTPPPAPTATATPTLQPTATATPTPTTTSTATPTVAPAETATPTASRPAAATATPTPPSTPTTVPASPTATADPALTSGTIKLLGCTTAPPRVQLEFVPLGMLALEGSAGQPTGPGLTVPAVQSPGVSGNYAFDLPGVEPGRLYQFSITSEIPGCQLDLKAGKGFWVAGGAVNVPVVLPGATSLEACALIDKDPCEYTAVKGAFIRFGEPPEYTESPLESAAEGAWVTELAFYPGDLKGRKQRFRWSTEFGTPSGATLQASVWPYPKGVEDDPLSPPGLVASWPVECANCEFVADLSILAPPSKPAQKSLVAKGIDLITAPFKAAGQAVMQFIGSLFGGKTSAPPAVQAGEPVLPSSKPSDYLVGGAANPLLAPTTYYFRVVPLSGEKPSGAAASNTVRLQQVAKPPALKIDMPTPTPTPSPSAYEVQITAYHGIIPPIKPDKDQPCYIVAQDAWPADPWGLKYTTDPANAWPGKQGVKAGAAFCEPDPEEPGLFESIVSWFKDAVNLASKAWTGLKGLAVDIVMKFTPLGPLCETVGSAGDCKAAFSTALDAALVSLGIPPDLPNFDQLMDQGIEYLAAQAAAQVGIPKDVLDAASKLDPNNPYYQIALQGGAAAVEAKLREEVEDGIKSKLKDGIKSIQLSYSAAIGWIPDGIPVRPDDYQPPGASVRVTRKPGVPGGDAGCTVTIRDGLKLDAATLQNPPPGYEAFLKNLPHPLSPLTTYDLFVNEADLASQGFPGGPDKELSVAPMAPGESVIIPMTFKPSYYKSGWSPSGLITVTDYIYVWRFLHDFGTITLDAGGTCGPASLKAPAKAQVLGAAAQ